jgi:hypothetical protein
MERFENWQYFTFNDLSPNVSKPNRDAVFNIHYKRDYRPKKNLDYFQALFRNAELIKDIYGGPFDVLFSGGIDSEIIIRTFHELGINQNVYTFRFENNINCYDVEHAIKTCDIMGIKHNIIDFPLKKFLENDAVSLYQISYPSTVEKLVRLKFYDYLDNIPVVGDGEPYWHRDLFNDFSKKSKWSLFSIEHDYANSIHAKAINRTIIGEWFLFTPEIAQTYIKIPHVKNLLQDKVPGKLSNWTYRCELHRTLWPDIIEKIKCTGYDGSNKRPNRPKFMSEFQAKYMQEKEKGFKLSKKDVENWFNPNYTLDIDGDKFFEKFDKIQSAYWGYFDNTDD